MLRLLRGQSLEALSRELGVTAAKLSEWRDQFLEVGRLGFKARKTAPVEEDSRRLKAKIGDITMDTEVFQEFCRMRGYEDPLAARKRNS